MLTVTEAARALIEALVADTQIGKQQLEMIGKVNEVVEWATKKKPISDKDYERIDAQDAEQDISDSRESEDDNWDLAGVAAG